MNFWATLNLCMYLYFVLSFLSAIYNSSICYPIFIVPFLFDTCVDILSSRGRSFVQLERMITLSLKLLLIKEKSSHDV